MQLLFLANFILNFIFDVKVWNNYVRMVYGSLQVGRSKGKASGSHTKCLCSEPSGVALRHVGGMVSLDVYVVLSIDHSTIIIPHLMDGIGFFIGFAKKKVALLN